MFGFDFRQAQVFFRNADADKRVIDNTTDLLAVGCILAFTDIDSNERHILSPDAAGLFSATLGAAFETGACFYLATARLGMPGGVKSEPAAGRHAYPVMRNHTENDGASRGTITVDDRPLARHSRALISVDVGSDPAARVIHNPNRRIACSNSCEQGSRRE